MDKVIVVCGLPGSGKSTLARALAKKLHFPMFSKDRLEASIVENGLAKVNSLNNVGYSLLKSLVEEHINLQQSVVVDLIANRGRIKELWPSLLDMNFIALECICSNPDVHKKRVESRQRNLPGWYELTWQDVERASLEYVPLTASRLVLDSMKDITDNLEEAVQYVKMTNNSHFL